MWNVAGSFSITHQQNSITKTVFSYSFDISQKMCSFSSVWWINIIIFLHSRNQGRGVHALLVLLPLSSRKAELTTTTPYWWHYETFKVAKIIPKTDFGKHLKNLEVQHLIHFDYYYLFVVTLTYQSTNVGTWLQVMAITAWFNFALPLRFFRLKMGCQNATKSTANLFANILQKFRIKFTVSFFLELCP